MMSLTDIRNGRSFKKQYWDAGLQYCWQVKRFKDSVSIEFGNTVIVDEIIQSCLNGVMGKEASSVRAEG